MSYTKKPKLAILDMYNGEANQGMRCIIELVKRYEGQLDWKHFDVRQHNELPNFEEYDLYISSGGPGNPVEDVGPWEARYYELLDNLWKWNKEVPLKARKHVFFICHSFQMACAHFELAGITKRKAMSFGLYPVHKTKDGFEDHLLSSLNDPFYAVDSRFYQVVKPKKSQLNKLGAKIIALEKIRDHVGYERAIMAVRFSDEFVGTQFHPEADPMSFIENLRDPKKREEVIRIKGKRKFRDMLEGLLDDEKALKTRNTIIPFFIENALAKLIGKPEAELVDVS